MNERIKPLWDQCVRDYGHAGREACAQMFAELLIQECVEQLELVRKYRYDRIQPLETQQTIIDECQYQIKQHFGVEE
jgi:hypothetical protein